MGKVLRVVQSLYQGTRTSMQLGSVGMEGLGLGVGLQQGCVLSPLLFALYLQDLGTRLQREGLGVEVGDVQILVLMFVDDLVLIGKDQRELSREEITGRNSGVQELVGYCEGSHAICSGCYRRHVSWWLKYWGFVACHPVECVSGRLDGK